jgi:hypothetical protein
MQDAMHAMRPKTYSIYPFYESKATTIVLLYLVTLGFYEHYWHYKNWKTIQRNSGDLTLSPILRGIFFPFFIIPLISVIKGAAETASLKQGIARTSFGVVYIFLFFVRLSIDNPYYLLSLIFFVLPLWLLQRKNSQINCYFLENKTELKGSVTTAPSIEAQPVSPRQIAKKHSNYRDFILPEKFTIELSTFVIVMAIGLSFALHDAERAYAKMKLTDIMSFISVAKIDLAETYAFTGEWMETDLNYLFRDSGSRLIKSVWSSSNGSIHFELKEYNPFKEHDALSFVIKGSDNTSPIHINRWECNPKNNPAENRTTLIEDYLPSICRG